MTQRICSYCALGYTDEEGPHPYETCVARLDEQIAPLVKRVSILTARRDNARRSVNEGSQKQNG